MAFAGLRRPGIFDKAAGFVIITWKIEFGNSHYFLELIDPFAARKKVRIAILDDHHDSILFN